MALVVHGLIEVRGRTVRRGEVLFGDEADEVARHPMKSRVCTPVPDDAFAHLKPAAAPVKPAPSPIGETDSK